MVVIDIEVNAEKKRLYVDGYLYRQLTSKIIPRVKKKDSDYVIVVDGNEGSGKSVFAFQLAKILDPTFDISRVCMVAEDFTKAILNAKKGECVVYDEAFTGLSSRNSLTEVNRLIVSLMMEMRQKNLFVIIVMPTFFLLDRYVSLFRCRGLFHIYLKHGKRGQWAYFNNRKKKILYLIGRKLLDYNKPRASFYGRFLEQYTIDESEYREKKGKALHKKSHSTRSETWKIQRDTLFYIMNQKLNIDYVKIAKLCKECDFKIDRTVIYDAMLSTQRRLINKAEEGSGSVETPPETEEIEPENP